MATRAVWTIVQVTGYQKEISAGFHGNVIGKAIVLFNSISEHLTGLLANDFDTYWGCDCRKASRIHNTVPTDAVTQQYGEQYGHSHGAESRAPPRAVLGRFLELEGAAGERVAGQGPRGGRVYRPRGHGVAWCGRAEERSGAGACFKEKVPERQREKEKDVFILHGTALGKTD